MEGPLLAIEHGKDVKVQGITFEYGRHIGVYMENTHRALIKNCIIRNMGGVGVSIGKGTLKAGNQRGHESGGNPASRVVGDFDGNGLSEHPVQPRRRNGKRSRGLPYL